MSIQRISNPLRSAGGLIGVAEAVAAVAAAAAGGGAGRT